ncbi:UNVERIFIED_CONTAM: putative inactive leucine-rich repeat receptor-like protein kinase [Sesamum latifolium]|uniref:non-specific serine/threonine protein kinase n=1 Tax=Sesamum latifolium TaxID=2727402 RepID=A0AAW2Y3S6_9LAMI
MIAVVMSMLSSFRVPPALVSIFIWLLVIESFGHAAQTDIDCLRAIKTSLEDPFNYLSSWNFDNTTEGYICRFAGVECWHPDENKVLNIRLGDMGLRGEFPLGVSSCSSLTGFDLSSNSIRGNIPSNISKLIESYANNPGLCGDPLPPCQGPSKKNHTPAILGGGVGGSILGALGITIVSFSLSPSYAHEVFSADAHKELFVSSVFQLSMFEKSISKMNLNDLMKATDSFSKENIIGTGRTGIIYKAVLEDGTSLMVKRLQDTQHSEKEFISEMTTLGSVKHRNLVPLLGFCMTTKERLLVYQHMPNGTLHDKLHNVKDSAKPMDWPLRLKIGIRAAKGFAWLHHSCNPRIIHRNISSNCILLDGDYEPKISDFGLARLMNPVDTHLSTFVNGEFGDLGYVAPEYMRTLVATPKGDVYSFGVVLLELVTGEKPTYVAKAPESFKGNLVEWVSQLSSTSTLQDAIDTSLVGKGFDSELFQFLKIACRCVLPGPKERPSMFELYQLLRAVGQRYDFTTEDEVLQIRGLAHL